MQSPELKHGYLTLRPLSVKANGSQKAVLVRWCLTLSDGDVPVNIGEPKDSGCLGLVLDDNRGRGMGKTPMGNTAVTMGMQQNAHRPVESQCRCTKGW